MHELHKYSKSFYHLSSWLPHRSHDKVSQVEQPNVGSKVTIVIIMHGAAKRGDGVVYVCGWGLGDSMKSTRRIAAMK